MSQKTPDRNNPALWLLLGILFSVLIILPTFLKQPVYYLTLGGVLDLGTPLIICPLYVFLFLRGRSFRWDAVFWIFLLGLILFVEGHGLHLAADSINKHLGKINFPNNLAYFFDEHLSHVFWHVGVLLISLAYLLILEERKSSSWRIVVGGILYGLAFGIASIEGQTVWLVLPASVLLFLLAVLGYKKRAMAGFFLPVYGTLLILFLAWGLRHHGFPQFSDLGRL